MAQRRDRWMMLSQSYSQQLCAKCERECVSAESRNLLLSQAVLQWATNHRNLSFNGHMRTHVLLFKHTYLYIFERLCICGHSVCCLYINTHNKCAVSVCVMLLLIGV